MAFKVCSSCAWAVIMSRQAQAAGLPVWPRAGGPGPGPQPEAGPGPRALPLAVPVPQQCRWPLPVAARAGLLECQCVALAALPALQVSQ
jgi:hypothetical protein